MIVARYDRTRSVLFKVSRESILGSIAMTDDWWCSKDPGGSVVVTAMAGPIFAWRGMH